MAAQPPLALTAPEIFNLQQLGNQGTSIRMEQTTMQSDQWVVSVQSDRVIVVDLYNGRHVTTLTLRADAAMMNPNERILAVRRGKEVQMVHLDTGVLLKSHVMSKAVVFWKWIDGATPTDLVLVTSRVVYRWSTDLGDGEPAKVCPNTLYSCVQPTNCLLSSNDEWCLLGGTIDNHAPGSERMQLYSLRTRQIHAIQGSVGAFASITLLGRRGKIPVLVYVQDHLDYNEPHRLIIVEELEHDPSGNPFKARYSIWNPNGHSKCPESISIDPEDDIAFMAFSCGLVTMFDLRTGKTIGKIRFSEAPFVYNQLHASVGLGMASHNGRFFRLQWDKANLVQHLMDMNPVSNFNTDLCRRLNLPIAEEQRLRDKFEFLMSVKRYYEAANLVMMAETTLRTPETMARFHGALTGTKPNLHFFDTVLRHGATLTEHESIELANVCLVHNEFDKLESVLEKGKIHCSKALSRLIVARGICHTLEALALSETDTEAIHQYASRGEFEAIIVYVTDQIGVAIDYWGLLGRQLFGFPWLDSTFHFEMVRYMVLSGNFPRSVNKKRGASCLDPAPLMHESVSFRQLGPNKKRSFRSAGQEGE